MAIPVSQSLGGGAEHAQSMFIRNRSSGPDAVSNQSHGGPGVMSTHAGGAHPSHNGDSVTKLWHAG
jgi:hypothetical protein